VLTAGDPSTLVDLARNWHATVLTRSGVPILATITSAGGSDPPPVTSCCASAWALSCEAASRRFSSVQAASQRHVPWMCLRRPGTQAPGWEPEHCQERVDSLDTYRKVVDL